MKSFLSFHVSSPTHKINNPGPPDISLEFGVMQNLNDCVSQQIFPLPSNLSDAISFPLQPEKNSEGQSISPYAPRVSILFSSTKLGKVKYTIVSCLHSWTTPWTRLLMLNRYMHCKKCFKFSTVILSCLNCFFLEWEEIRGKKRKSIGRTQASLLLNLLQLLIPTSYPLNVWCNF